LGFGFDVNFSLINRAVEIVLSLDMVDELSEFIDAEGFRLKKKDFQAWELCESIKRRRCCLLGGVIGRIG